MAKSTTTNRVIGTVALVLAVGIVPMGRALAQVRDGSGALAGGAGGDAGTGGPTGADAAAKVGANAGAGNAGTMSGGGSMGTGAGGLASNGPNVGGRNGNRMAPPAPGTGTTQPGTPAPDLSNGVNVPTPPR